MLDLELARSIRTGTRQGRAELDLTLSVAATEATVAELAGQLRGQEIDIVITWDDPDNLVLGHGVARELGVERGFVREDMGRLLTFGPELAGRQVAVAALTWTAGEMTRLESALRGAGAEIVAEAEAIDAATLAALAKSP